MESFSTLFTTKTQAKVPSFNPLCSKMLKHRHLGCHCMFVSLYIYWTNNTDWVLAKLSYLCCFSCSVGVVAQQLKSFTFAAVKLAAAAKEGPSCLGVVVMQSVKIAMVVACIVNLY